MLVPSLAVASFLPSALFSQSVVIAYFLLVVLFCCSFWLSLTWLVLVFVLLSKALVRGSWSVCVFVPPNFLLAGATARVLGLT